MYVRHIEVTKREVLVCISIVAVMLIIGLLIGSAISDACADRNEVYNKAVKLDTTDMFEYGMRTNVGNAFVYGDLKAIDTVTYPEIGGEYMYVEKIKERYTQHTRTVTKTRVVNGKTQTYTTTETYWSWNRVGSETRQCEEITFLGVIFDSEKIQLPGEHHIDTIKESSRIRYKYYGVDTEHIGTIFTDLRDDTISDRTPFYKNSTIPETVERLQMMDWSVVFWIFWIILTGGACYGFCYLDNRWIE
jgi:hypothetical protein